MQLPSEITTGCPELNLVWRMYAREVVEHSAIAIPDTEDDLNWHAFLGHSIDMQGFRAAEFVGVDPLTKDAPKFVSLRQRGVGVAELASLWQIPAIREHLLTGIKGAPLQKTLDLLRSKGANIGQSLADAFQQFPYRKGHWSVRAFLQNSAELTEHDHSFRSWLHGECARLGVTAFPARDFRQIVALDGSCPTLEEALRLRLANTFYKVGPTMAPYMICDWQLWLWVHDLTAVFASFKWDAFQDRFVRRYSRGAIPTDEQNFVRWWFEMYPDLPPRLPNECIWLGTEYGVV